MDSNIMGKFRVMDVEIAGKIKTVDVYWRETKNGDNLVIEVPYAKLSVTSKKMIVDGMIKKK